MRNYRLLPKGVIVQTQASTVKAAGRHLFFFLERIRANAEDEKRKWQAKHHAGTAENIRRVTKTKRHLQLDLRYKGIEGKLARQKRKWQAELQR
jgi:hypothetical protein